MFNIGDSIAYPMHGAGVVTEIEEKEVLGEICRYYHVSLPYSKMHVMVPVDNSDKVGVRAIIVRKISKECLMSLVMSPIRCLITGIEGIERIPRSFALGISMKSPVW